MKMVLPHIMASFILITGCSTERQAEGDSESTMILDRTYENLTICDTPRPEICTMNYLPVCGVSDSGNRKTFSNGCVACSSLSVIGFEQGSC